MFPVSAPGSVAWQPDPGWRLLHGIVTSWKYGHLVRCSRFPPTVAQKSTLCACFSSVIMAAGTLLH